MQNEIRKVRNRLHAPGAGELLQWSETPPYIPVGSPRIGQQIVNRR